MLKVRHSRRAGHNRHVMPWCSQCSSHYEDRFTICPSCEAADTVHRPKPKAHLQQDAPPIFTAGTIINDRYRVISRLGHGAMGDVYRAEDLELGEDVALKFLPDSLRNATTIELLRNEVRLARTIAHPNVCRVFDISSTEGRYFVSMEFVDGENLASLLRRIDRLPAEKAVQFALQLCEGLDAAHRTGILHRDLKPSNILIDRGGRVHISDFGLACETDDERWREMACGTPAYMAPERRVGGGASVESDLFALGLTIKEIFTGSAQAPWPEDEAEPLVSMARKVVAACTHEDAGQRPHSAAEVASMLQDVAGEAQVAIATARRAAARQQWRAAFEALSPYAKSDRLSAGDLEILAEAAFWSGDLEACINAHERAYAQWLSEGNRERAARAALRLVSDYAHRVAPAVSNGWLATADRLLRDLPETAAQGWLSRARAAKLFEHREYDGAYSEATRCQAIALRQHDRDLEAIAVHEQGRALLKKGELEKGWALLDEAAVAAISGELGAYATGVIFCNVLVACRLLADYDRATAWSEAARRWCDRQSISGFPGVCRIYRAELMRLRGRWSEAQEETLRAAAELQSFSPAITRSAFYELGEIRLRMGDLAGAEQAFGAAQELGLDPEPGMSLLRLRQGRGAAALASLQRALAEAGTDPLDRARILGAAIEVGLRTDHAESAREAAKELEHIASAYTSSTLRATAAYGQGLVEQAAGRTHEARQHFRAAAALWIEIDAPYERALTQVRIAELHRDAREEDAAVLAAQSALATFERLGASLDAAEVRQFIAAGRRVPTGAG